MRPEILTTPRAWQIFVEDLGYSWNILPHLHAVAETWPHPPRIPRHYGRQIEWDNPHDPLLLQVLPTQNERTILEHELNDPIGDHEHMVLPGVVHRYKDRVLLWPHLACGIHCRFCFRREDVGSQSGINWFEVSEYIKTHPEINEVILSGGDPGLLPSSTLQRIVDRVGEIDHVTQFRIHSRVLATDPERLSAYFLDELATFAHSRPDRSTTIVHHVNHARELTPESQVLSDEISKRGILQKAQGVLLRGVNDKILTQRQLWEGLSLQGVSAYYLHHLDMAQGTSHFRLSIEEGLSLYSEMQNTLAAESLPKYILDLPGGKGKVEVTSLQKMAHGQYSVMSPVTQEEIVYRDPALLRASPTR